MKPAESWTNLVSMFFAQAEARGEAPFLWAKRNGVYHALTWREAAVQVSGLARGLRALGVEPGDRVVLVSENRPEWPIADLAIMAAGGVTVPAYTTNTEKDHLHILADSGAKGAIVSTRRLARNLLPALLRSPESRFAVALEDAGADGHAGRPLHSWAEVLDKGGAAHWNVVAEAERLGRGDLACLIYTSGTGGTPKGVMLSHGAILHNCAGARDALEELGLGDEVFLSFLPLSHSYEHTAGQFFPISIGAQIYYAEGVETLGTNMAEARPTIMTAVPRLYEMLHSRIVRGVEKEGGLKETLFKAALDLGRRRYGDPAGLGLADRLADAVLDRLVRDKVRSRFGGRLKALVSGGAPLNPDVGVFFTALGLRILQGYGQTESAPVVSVNRPLGPRMHTVGPPLKDVEVRIAQDGEILVRGELVMLGYWGDVESSRQTVKDGWLHTGDIGEFDADGHLRITDRKKDIIVNSGGDNVAPQRIEGFLCLEPEIGQAMVFGDKRPHLVALLVPDADWLKTWADARGKMPDLRLLADDDDLRKTLGAAVERVNRTLGPIEKVRRFLVATEPFSIENGEMTPTLKIRRHVIKARYGTALEKLYG
ncbi:MAG: AMP-binding protein [Magnetospirillum sp. WYHS-4]